MSKKTIAALFACLILSTPVIAQNNGADPVGATTAQDLYSPDIAGRGGFTTSRGGSSASALNPAAEGEAQRIIFDLGYLGLPSFGNEEGFGVGAFDLGAIFPTRYGVFGGSLWFLQSPFNSFPVKTVFNANFTAAKELYPGMSLGAGVNIGANTGNSWTLSADLGIRYNMGNLGPLENFTWAFTARSLGKSWVPPMFTPAAGIAFDFLHVRGEKSDPLRMSFAADLMSPTVQNLAGKLGLSIIIAEVISVSASTQFNVKEAIDKTGPMLVPSIGAGAIFKLKSGGRRLVADTLPSDGELAVNLAAKPLYNNIWAMGGGVTWTVGVMDRNPPLIIAEYGEAVWISPNQDGRADDLEFPVSITDDRYVVEWVFEIRDESGASVRVYRNKELRPETRGVRNFFDRLTAVKAGVDIPATMRWDGVLESGGIAPDGRYFFTITAKDDNGNTGQAGPFEVYVDCTPPEIVLAPFVDEENIFSPGGGGSKNTLSITQAGSLEDLWEAGIYDAGGNIVRTFNFINAEPVAVVWDGANDSGEIVPDGIYSYRIRATDRAMNSAEASLENIIVNTTRPSVGLAITDAFFSPNGDGVKDTESFILTVPVKEGIIGWELQITDRSNSVRRTISGTAAVPGRIEFDGRDEAGRVLPEAEYSGTLSVRYRNGYTSTALSPGFTLDITPPRAAVRVEDTVFSPFNANSSKNELVIRQEGSDEASWFGEISRDGTPVRTFRFSGTPPSTLVWNGLTDSGSLAPDGLYTYALRSTDLAGNSGQSNSAQFEVNTRDTPVLLSTDVMAFSPAGTAGNSAKTSVNLIPQLQESEGVVSWKIDIRDTVTGTLVRGFEGRNTVPAAVNWNGRTGAGTAAADGSYTAKLDVEYRNGNRPSASSPAFVIDTVPPQGTASAPFNIFAPNGNANRGVLPINVTTEGSDSWTAVITNSQNQTVRSWNWTGRAPSNPLIWDGKDQAGNSVADGTYAFTLSAADEAGNSTRRDISNIVVDARVPRIFLTASAQYIAPKQGQAEAMRFSVMNSLQEGISSWKLELLDERGGALRTFPSPMGGSGAVSSSIIWNGANEQGNIVEGRYTPVLTVSYAKGDVVTAAAPPVTVDISGPILNFRSSPEYFSPDNDGVEDELFIYLSARDASPLADWSLDIYETEGTRQLFYHTGGRGTPSERIIWDGRSNRGELVQGATDYRYVYRAGDILGNSSSVEGTITTDVLVIRDGDVLRIMVPSITFRANAADFNGIPRDRLDTNERVLRRIAVILNRFRDYRITVEGHANPVLGTQAEEANELQPLSRNRAQAIVNQLAGYGVARSRLSATGRGGTRTVANPRDQNNSWKNRRVEFILNK